MKKDDIEENVEEIEINTEFIKLDQLLKWANFTASGAEANRKKVVFGRCY